MDHNVEPGRWYNTSDRREWYRQYTAPSVPGAPVPQEVPAKPRKKHTGMKIVSLVLCVLVLIAATAVAFSPRDSVSEPSLSGGETVRPTPAIGGGASGSADNYEDFHAFFDSYYTMEDQPESSSIQRAATGTGVTLALHSSQGLEKLTLQEVYSRNIDSVVGIMATVKGSYDVYYWGTGIIMTEDGYILTNAHVIAGTDAATVVLSDGREYEALLVGEDSQSDIAVLKVEASGLQAASFGDSSELQVGDDVVAIGNPLGSELSGTMTNGIVSAINRGILMNGHVMTLIQTNAALNEGNSGGPLFNMYGQVIGITNMKMAADYSEVTIEGIGFAIPTSVAKGIVDQLIDDGIISGRPGIGITVGSIPTQAAVRWDLPYGLYISSVVENSDAYAKGIRPGDILVSVNGIEVYTTDDVNTIKDGYGVGDTLLFTIYRDGKTFDVEVELVDMNELY